MTTSFSQVHLPSSTIDAVRTIASLRLLHPHAFQQGILKEHGMTGCLLFGPPGTGKTSVIGAYVQFTADLLDKSGIWLVAQSNVAVKNIAEKLIKIGFTSWRLLVSKDFHFDW